MEYAVSLASAGAGSVFARYLRSAGTDRLGSFFQQTWRGAERLYAHHFESEDRDAADIVIYGVPVKRAAVDNG
jgi:hypothetical protein